MFCLYVFTGPLPATGVHIGAAWRMWVVLRRRLGELAARIVFRRRFWVCAQCWALAQLASWWCSLVGQAAGKAATGGGTDSCRHSTPRVWLAYETRVTPTVAGSMLADQDFLDRQPEIATARAAGDLSWQHITAFRTVVTGKPWREAPFAQVVDHFVTVAQCSDPTELRRALNSWAEATDDEVAPDRPDRAYADRALHLRQVGEIWDIRGTLPKLEGATLAGVLDEVIAAARRAGCTCGQDPCSCPDDATPRATKRADALTALAGWATAHRTCLADDPLLSAGGAQRSRPMIIVPLDRLAPTKSPPACESS